MSQSICFSIPARAIISRARLLMSAFFGTVMRCQVFASLTCVNRWTKGYAGKERLAPNMITYLLISALLLDAKVSLLAFHVSVVPS